MQNVEMRQLETYVETAVRPQMSVGVEQRRLQTSGTAETAVHPQLSGRRIETYVDVWFCRDRCASTDECRREYTKMYMKMAAKMQLQKVEKHTKCVEGANVGTARRTVHITYMFLESTTAPPPRKRRAAEGGPLPPQQCGSGRPAGLRAQRQLNLAHTYTIGFCLV